ncbi:membrane protein YczE [Martelella alba]|uniref:membrane protein YczE n=1 Tax=Martelella alba TaxID=2590451 RepID=UPI00148552E2|nr:hypothetical protein [Martelella alba]
MLGRLLQLYTGLSLYGLSIGVYIRANLGLDPWDVFHQGLAGRLSLSIGHVIILVGAAVLVLWIPLRQLPGLGTVSNVIVLGVVADATLSLLPPVDDIVLRGGLLLGGIVINAIATAMYIGANFGPGPRDGLMTGINRRTGWSIKYVRTAIELTVLTVGWLLGGTLGIGTVIYAVTIGPLIQIFIPWFARTTTYRRI